MQKSLEFGTEPTYYDNIHETLYSEIRNYYNQKISQMMAILNPQIPVTVNPLKPEKHNQ